MSPSPSRSEVPLLVVHVPHASTVVPADVRETFLLDDTRFEAEILRMTDHHTDDLFALPREEAVLVRHPVSRLVVDPERFEDDALESMAGVGMGVLYVRTADGTRLRADPTPEAREDLLARFYRPHHRRLASVVDTALSARGRCLLLDAHSFPDAALPYETDPDGERPDICLGTDAFHTPSWLGDLARAVFERRGFSVEIDRPFAGALVPAKAWRRDRRVLALMVEVNRRLYLDGRTDARSSGYLALRSRLQHAMRVLAGEVERRILA